MASTEYKFGLHGVCVVNKTDGDDEAKKNFDIISALPLEISTTILRMLDPSTIQAAMLVSKRWYGIYRSDPMIERICRRRVRQQIRERNRFAKYLHNPRHQNGARRRSQNNSDKKRKPKKIQSQRLDKKLRFYCDDQLSSSTARRPMRM